MAEPKRNRLLVERPAPQDGREREKPAGAGKNPVPAKPQ